MSKIEVTQEMVQAYRDAWHRTPPGALGDRTRAGLKAVLEIVVRDLEKRK